MNQATLQRRPAAASPIDLSQFDFNEIARQALQPWADALETWRAGVTDLIDRPQARERTFRDDHRHRRFAHGAAACRRQRIRYGTG